MSCQQPFRSPSLASSPLAVSLLALGTLLCVLAQPAWSDDRDLLRETSGNPYVFVLFDTSGSMNQTPDTSAELLAAADSPDSKMYQAKEALYEVISEFDDIHYGFATFNQDDLRVHRKHWIYQPQAAPSWSATLSYPLVGEGYAFGGGAPSNTQYSCGSPRAVSAAAPSNLNLSVYPRTGEIGDQVHGIWLRQSNRTYFVQTRIKQGSLGDPVIKVELTRRRLNNFGNPCNNNPPGFDETVGPIEIDYALVTDTLLWTQDTSPGFSDKTAGNTCSGWDPNTDTGSDDYFIGSPFNQSVNLKYPTTVNALSPLLNTGDVLPLHWSNSNKDEVLRRLAPNLRLAGETVPDFRIARYFKDQPTGSIGAGRYALELKNPSARPLVAEGSTPLGNSVEAFRTWYAGCPRGTCPKNTGWKDLAATYDPDWPCKKKYLIVLTDGDETCSNGNGACSATASLRAQEGVTTFVIAFGVQGGGNVLTCMAANGGSGKPVYPQDKTALLDELRKIFSNIREQSRTFASAAVPGVQAEVQDKIYLTNFTPLNGNSYWDGHVDAYLKPLPLTTAGLPEKTRRCDVFNLESGCLAWDAGEEILDLAPSAADLAKPIPDFQIGEGVRQRRVFYTQTQTSSVPATRRLFEWEQITGYDYATKVDLWTGLGISPIPGPADASGINAATQETLGILKSTFRVKTDTIQDPFGGPPRPITYLLGDIFHSNPILLSTPNRLRYFADDLYTQNKKCSAGDPGYRCFAKRHERRRKMLIVGSNDQQLHIFDAGIFRGDLKTGLFDDGTGYEIYSYVPRPVLPNLKKQAEESSQQWGVDGTIQFDDVFIDPRHNGTPTPAQRHWRSVVVGGLREGGSGYFALDLTQPDTLDSDNLPQPLNGDWVPSCWDRGSDTDTECGPVPFGAVLWSFTDTADDDNNGYFDLGDTWSTPNTGRIRVKVSTGPDVFEDKYVAIFGGGMDPEGLNRRGNWLYMVDIETGKALYKRRLDGSAPSDPAAIDGNQDGYLDTVYIGTTAGSLYKVDLRTPPLLVDVPLLGKRVVDPAWEPFKVFDTVQTTGPTVGRRGPIFFPPSVIFVTQLGRYVLAFGTGNRQDLWAKDGTPGRFYVILDESFEQGMTPRRESDYANITPTVQAPTGVDYLLRPQTGNKPGWFLELDPDERIITKAFGLSGILIFTSYDPRTVLPEGGNGNGNGNGNNAIPVCARSGESNIFTVYTTTGDPVGNPTPVGDPDDPDGPGIPTLDQSRSRRVGDFVTNPFVESSSTKNKLNPACKPGEPGCLPPPPPICKDKEVVTQRLMALFPSNCQFASHTQNIETIQSDNGLVCIAPVPVCVVRKNWKEN